MPSAWGAGGLAERDIAARSGRAAPADSNEANVASTGFPELGGTGRPKPGPDQTPVVKDPSPPSPASAPSRVEEKALESAPLQSEAKDGAEVQTLEDTTEALLERLEPMGGAGAFLTVTDGLDLAQLLGLLHVIRGDAGVEGLDIPAWKELSASVQSFGGPRAILNLLQNDKVRETVAEAIAEQGAPAEQGEDWHQDELQDVGPDSEGPPSSPPPAPASAPIESPAPEEAVEIHGPPPAAAPPPAEPPAQVPTSAPRSGGWADLVRTGAAPPKWGKGGLGTAWSGGKGATALRPPSEPPPPAAAAAAQPQAVDLAPGPKPKASAPEGYAQQPMQPSQEVTEVQAEQAAEDEWKEVEAEPLQDVDSSKQWKAQSNGDSDSRWNSDEEWLKQGWTKDASGWWHPPKKDASSSASAKEEEEVKEHDDKAAWVPATAPPSAPPSAPAASNLAGQKLAEWLRRQVFERRVSLPMGQAELLEVLQNLDDEKLQPPFEEAKLWLGFDESDSINPALERLLMDFRDVRAKP
mmetsp:Transcript_2395/g.4373  ORF Transcript_2395/g.4373 Transcript_2395/m.4373 type:complete len:523 (-) Transcript_2395:153-1721(-)|eukprot:CAMPEP_0197665274 /NCGR_PEP_ID=MMETSP1338-20131121/59129_1 /TAXON_ID=43686 ORGANISM="Pelagodinium beii, Strain RCC1491" /NCGR_SAMPLE_ID=MMETSP1338 /ASSEMBLY_ACC=CAM_ASM_000754 /LENGTH=522 /DNA_ID=CAMNT_0043244051 /DNA_START=57 /DNA_END=1625 /DNA_ORIENTATION=-